MISDHTRSLTMGAQRATEGQAVLVGLGALVLFGLVRLISLEKSLTKSERNGPPRGRLSSCRARSSRSSSAWSA